MDDEPWPTLGPQVIQLLRERSIFGPGSLKGEPYEPDAEFEAQVYRAYEVYPRWHEWAGRRRFKRVGISVRKGLAKTEKLAELAFAELHPEGPVRCDGFDAAGNPVGRPVRDPYIPLLAVTVEQVEELAYGALYVLCTEGPDADLFDATLDRILRLGSAGQADGKAVPLSNSPGARDGARTTFQGFDEPHRLYLPRAVAAHETMVANLEKRVLEDPWGCYVGTAGELGQQSIAEGLHQEAESISRGEIDDPQLFYFHRDAGPGHDLSTLDGRIAAVSDATGPIGEYGPGQFYSIAKQWERPKADKRYLERVWLNRWVSPEARAFDIARVLDLVTDDPIPDGSVVSAGFDGARFRDSTALVITDFASGRQQVVGLWQRPLDADGDWEVDFTDVQNAVEAMQQTWRVAKAYADPPYWVKEVGEWAGKWPEVWQEWWTNFTKRTAWAVRAYREAMQTGDVTFVQRDPTSDLGLRDADFVQHVGNAGRKGLNLYDDNGEQLFILAKLHPDRKFDAAMAGVLSYRAHLDLIAEGGPREPKQGATWFMPIKVR